VVMYVESQRVLVHVVKKKKRTVLLPSGTNPG
jgi:hypothetical protein